jgi:hypothetical protein
MFKLPVCVLMASIGLAVPVAVAAHHGSAAFESGKTVVLKGTVKEWVYSNPHCLLVLDVKGEDGKLVEWIAEGQAPNTIFPVGYRKDSFTLGDQVAITVEQVKTGQPVGRILEAVLADGSVLGRASSAGAPPPREQ